MITGPHFHMTPDMCNVHACVCSDDVNSFVVIAIKLRKRQLITEEHIVVNP